MTFSARLHTNFPWNFTRWKISIKTHSARLALQCCFAWAIWLAGTVSAQEVIAGPITNRENGSVYVLLSSSTWTQARAKAGQLGGRLAVIHDAFEENFLASHFGVTNGTVIHLWIGLAATNGTGQFEWVDEPGNQYTHWLEGWPQFVNQGRRFAYIRHYFDAWANESDHAWAGHEYQPHGVVEFPLAVAVEPRSTPLAERISMQLTTSASNSQPGQPLPRVIDGPYTNASNGHLYFLLSESTWTAAHRVANALGGYLFIPQSRAEETAIHNRFLLLGQTPINLWMGLADLNGDGSFEWVQGEPAPAYTNWYSGEPNFVGGVERFAHLTTFGPYWNDAANDPLRHWGSGFPLPHGVVEVNPGSLQPLMENRLSLFIERNGKLQVRDDSPWEEEALEVTIERSTNLVSDGWRPWVDVVLSNRNASVFDSLTEDSQFFRAKRKDGRISSPFQPPFRFAQDCYALFPGTNLVVSVLDRNGQAVEGSALRLNVSEYYELLTLSTNTAVEGATVRVLSGPGRPWRALRLRGSVVDVPIEDPAMIILYPSNNNYTVHSTAWWRLIVPQHWISVSKAAFPSFDKMLDLGDLAQTEIVGAKWQDGWNRYAAPTGLSLDRTHRWEALVEDSTTCGYNGTPMGFGEPCFLVAGRGAAWFPALFHERGHNSATIVDQAYGDVLGRSGFYVEGDANAMSRWSTHVILKSAHVDPASKQRLLYQWMPITVSNLEGLQRLANGRSAYDDRFGQPIWEGCFVALANDFGWEFIARYVQAWRADETIRQIVNGGTTDPSWRDAVTSEQRSTFAVAAVSAAVGKDLRELFRGWRFPLNDQLFLQLYERWLSTMQ